ncbi:MAG: hypothetical protein ACRENQ_04165, partial [Gemmatimonadaceae bacterium]
MNRYSLTLVLVAAALSVPASGSAQSTDTAHVAPVITTATRIPISAHDVPASVTLITGAQLRALGITT